MLHTPIELKLVNYHYTPPDGMEGEGYSLISIADSFSKLPLPAQEACKFLTALNIKTVSSDVDSITIDIPSLSKENRDIAMELINSGKAAVNLPCSRAGLRIKCTVPYDEHTSINDMSKSLLTFAKNFRSQDILYDTIPKNKLEEYVSANLKAFGGGDYLQTLHAMLASDKYISAPHQRNSDMIELLKDKTGIGLHLATDVQGDPLGQSTEFYYTTNESFARHQAFIKEQQKVPGWHVIKRGDNYNL